VYLARRAREPAVIGLAAMLAVAYAAYPHWHQFDVVACQAATFFGGYILGGAGGRLRGAPLIYVATTAALIPVQPILTYGVAQPSGRTGRQGRSVPGTPTSGSWSTGCAYTPPVGLSARGCGRWPRSPPGWRSSRQSGCARGWTGCWGAADGSRGAGERFRSPGSSLAVLPARGGWEGRLRHGGNDGVCESAIALGRARDKPRAGGGRGAARGAPAAECGPGQAAVSVIRRPSRRPGRTPASTRPARHYSATTLRSNGSRAGVGVRRTRLPSGANRVHVEGVVTQLQATGSAPQPRSPRRMAH
jgi:hypothetical protein